MIPTFLPVTRNRIFSFLPFTGTRSTKEEDCEAVQETEGSAKRCCNYKQNQKRKRSSESANGTDVRCRRTAQLVDRDGQVTGSHDSGSHVVLFDQECPGNTAAETIKEAGTFSHHGARHNPNDKCVKLLRVCLVD